MRTAWIAGVLLVTVSPAQAECLGSCAKDMEAVLLSFVVYLVIGIALLVMLIRAKWRRAGLWGLVLVAVAAVGVPLASQAWIAGKLKAVEGREIVGTPPWLSGRVPLLITPDEYCQDSACEAVVRGRGTAGVHVVLVSALEGKDLTQPVTIADLPIAYWWESTEGGDIRRRDLSTAERQEVAARIDYLVVTTWAYFPADPGPIEAALRINPVGAGMGAGETVRFLMAPLDPADGRIAFATLRPDLLDLSLLDRALAIPLAPRNTQDAGNSTVDMTEAAAAICPTDDPGGTCRSLLER